MKKIRIEILFSFSVLISILIVPKVKAQNELSFVKLNYAGYGIPYGGIPGVNIEISPANYLSLSAGLGLNKPVGIGWSIGSKLYFVAQNHQVRPYLSIYRGVVATLVHDYELYYEHGIGFSYGAGIEFRISKKLVAEIGGHVIDLNIPDDYKDFMPGWRYFSLGAGRCF